MTVSAPPLALVTYQTYAVAFCVVSLTGPIAATYVFPSLSEIVRFFLGEDAVPVTIRKSPALTLEGNASEIVEALFAVPVTASWIS